MGNNLLRFWVDEHKKLGSFRMMKASFLGLLSVLSHLTVLDLLTPSGMSPTQFLTILMEELVAVYLQYKKETAAFDEDYMSEDDIEVDVNDLVDSDNEEAEDGNDEALADQVTSITDRIAQIGEVYALEGEELCAFDYEYTQDAFDAINQIENFKQVVQRVFGSTPEIYETALAALKPEDVQTFKNIMDGKTEENDKK
jgi:hypothetical protein